uniref:DUF3119 family protein n=1 Tax=Kalanchoe fedtschenkoi TaxID=63787 RepID=A0A7N0U554_KALFE
MANALLSAHASSYLLRPHSRQVSELARNSPYYRRQEREAKKQVSIVIHGRRASTIVSAFGFRKANKLTERQTLIPDPDYRIPVVLLGIAGGLAYTDNIGPAVPIGILGLFLLIQEVKIGDKLEDSGENAFVGGKNRWKYSTFVNWEFWWPNFPVLVYFKETQTKPDGQIHFFPVLFNGRQLYEAMVERLGPSETSGPK